MAHRNKHHSPVGIGTEVPCRTIEGTSLLLTLEAAVDAS